MDSPSVLLVRPPSRATARFKNLGSLSPPMCLVEMATFLISKGIRASIVDFEAQPFSAAGFRRMLREKRPSLVGISVVSINFRSAKELCAIAKEEGMNCVLGGAHPSALPAQSLRDSGADAVIIGEGELTLLELARTPKTSWGRIRGLLLARKGRQVRTPPRPLIKDLDILPFPDRRLLDMDAYSQSKTSGVARRTAFVMASRGCPYSCSFCASSLILGRRWRAHGVEHVISELEDCASLGYEHAVMYDDIFGLDPRWLAEFCGRMVETGLARRLGWSIMMRVDLVSPERLAMMKRAGCEKICFGLESGSQRVLDRMRKGVTVGQTRAAFAAAKKAGLMTQAFVLVGFLGEEPRDVELTWKLLKETEPDAANFATFAPLPGTVAYDEAVKTGLYKPADDFKNQGFFMESAACGNGKMGLGEIARKREELYRRFYLRPSYMLRRLLKMRDIRDLAYNAQALLVVLGLSAER